MAQEKEKKRETGGEDHPKSMTDFLFLLVVVNYPPTVNAAMNGGACSHFMNKYMLLCLFYRIQASRNPVFSRINPHIYLIITYFGEVAWILNF